MRVILLRHGQTAWNQSRRYQGQTDVPLNRQGIQQAQRVAILLAQEPVIAVYASDLSRAQATAVVIARVHNLPVHIRPGLREISFGAWEARTYEELMATDPQRYQAWLTDPQSTTPPEGESLTQLQKRVAIVWQELTAKYQDANGTVVVVTHGGTIRVLLSWLEGVDFRVWLYKPIENTAMFELKANKDNWVITPIPCHSHPI